MTQSLSSKQPRPHDFEYSVKDYEGNDFGHSENSDGQTAQGTYYVQLPDGRLQTVTYTADDYAGYVADVQYEGEAQYPTHQPSSAYSAPAAPAPAPTYSAPAVAAPAPTYSAPSPAPTYSAPAAPVPTYSAPAAPAPTYSAPAPAPVPQNNYGPPH
ncbi:cuticle protein 19.8-like [Oratosquilla oratoria]|uniref:cuticle protein 19.8-like n=1 Tax=Oratosquilla oratoria TaxID=337810 RepID=UPI003F7730B7